jgi:hypothetical protein
MKNTTFLALATVLLAAPLYAQSQPTLQTTQPVSGSVTATLSGAVPAGSNLIGEVTPMATATRTDATVGCYVQSGTGTTASTNSTNCKGSAGNFYGFRAINTSTTIGYLRMYNASSAPTCSSSTNFIESIPIPPAVSAGNAGGVVQSVGIPLGDYSNGIGFCVTGGGGNTDNTSAPAGIYITIFYK